MRVLAVCLALAALLPAAAAAAWSESGPSTAACGSPSRVASYGTVGRGAAVGPLVFRFNNGRDGVAEKKLHAGAPDARRDPRARSGAEGPHAPRLPMRHRPASAFLYRNDPLEFPNGFPATDDELQHKGDLSLGFPATKKIGGTYSGYMLFWAPGKWRLVLSVGSSTVASVVVRVVEEPVE
jgi:hypothetical protein